MFQLCAMNIIIVNKIIFMLSSLSKKKNEKKPELQVESGNKKRD